MSACFFYALKRLLPPRGALLVLTPALLTGCLLSQPYGTPPPELGPIEFTWYADADGDGFGSAQETLKAAERPTGYAASTGDCDENDALTHAYAPEACDGKDNDCDGLVDEEVTARFYPDHDGDGYGLDTEATDLLPCTPTPGFVAGRGDCNDDDFRIYPGSTLAQEPGFDSGCSGLDGSNGGVQASVGLPSSTFDSLQAAVDAAVPESILWLGPGTYRVQGLDLKGKNLTLRGTHGSGHTFLDANHRDRVISASQSAGQTLRVEGLTLLNGQTPEDIGNGVETGAGGGIEARNILLELKDVRFHQNRARYGGGLFLQGGHAVLEDVVFRENVAIADGGGLFVQDASPVLLDVTATRNAADDLGGGFYCEASDAQLLDVSLLQNAAGVGGGAAFVDSVPTLHEVLVQDNQVDSSGGGLSFHQSMPTFERVQVRGNRVTPMELQQPEGTWLHLSGAGITLWDSPATFQDVQISDNLVQGALAIDCYGGGLYAKGSDLSLQDVAVERNVLACWGAHKSEEAEAQGAGLFVDQGALTASTLRVSQNWASATHGSGGGLAAHQSSVILTDATFEGNIANGWFELDEDGEVIFVQYVDHTVYVPAHGSGGAIEVRDGSSLRVDASTFAGNLTSAHFPYEFYDYTEGGGGAISVIGSDAELSHLQLMANAGMTFGGALYAFDATLRLSDSRLEGNEAVWASGVLGWSSDVTLTRSSVVGGTGGIRGAAIWQDVGLLRLTDVVVARGMGSGVTLMNGAEGVLKRVRIEGNAGSGVKLLGGKVLMENGVIAENHYYGIDTVSLFMDAYSYPLGSEMQLSHVTVAGNNEGGIHCLSPDTVNLSHSILAYNGWGNLLEGGDDGPCHLTAEYTNFYNPLGYNAPEEVLALPTLTTLEPGFSAFRDDEQLWQDDFHLRPGSQLIDAGDPSLCDVRGEPSCDRDGTVPDLGAFGGPQTFWGGWTDADADGLADAWEAQYGLDLQLNDASQDPDNDGLSNLEEQSANTNPQSADSDQDGEADAVELAAGADPLDSHQTSQGPLPWKVPGDFENLSAAIQRMPKWKTSRIDVGPGVWPLSMPVVLKGVILAGTGEGQTRLDGQGYPVFTVDNGYLGLERLTVQNGQGCKGAVSYTMSEGYMENVTFSNNKVFCSGYFGAALSLQYSDPTLSHVSFVNNTSQADASASAVGMETSRPLFRHVLFQDNHSSPTDFGGTVMMAYAAPRFEQTVFLHNTVEGGKGVAGLSLCASQPEFEQSVLAYQEGLLWATVEGEASGESRIRFEHSLVYQPGGLADAPDTVEGDFLTTEPGFLRYTDGAGNACTPGPDLSCLPADLHLSLSSPLRDGGAGAMLDVDGSASDLGLFGGPEGDLWDRDGDGLPDYFWPGLPVDVPMDIDASRYDCDDLNATIGACPIGN